MARWAAALGLGWLGCAGADEVSRTVDTGRPEIVEGEDAPLLAEGEPGGASVAARFCVRYRLTFADNFDPVAGIEVGDDFFADVGERVPALRPARGARIRVVRSDDPHDVGFDGFAAWKGPDAGCVTASLARGVRWDVEVHSEAEVAGSRVLVRDPADDSPWYDVVLSGWVAPDRDTVDVALATGLHDAWRMAAVLGWALKRRSGGVRATFRAFPGPCRRRNGAIATGGCAWRDADGSVRIYNDRPDWKYRTAHELGHALQIAAAGPARFAADAPPGGCWTTRPDGAEWEHNAKEYQGNAAVEGFAEYYAALTFNRDFLERDCALHARNPVDWDLDGVPDGTFARCAGRPVPRSVVDGDDYLGDWCGPEANRATVIDHVRMYWALGGPDGPPLADVLAIWRAADPPTWSDRDPPEPGAAPTTRLSFAAHFLGWGERWGRLTGLHGTNR